MNTSGDINPADFENITKTAATTTPVLSRVVYWLTMVFEHDFIQRKAQRIPQLFESFKILQLFPSYKFALLWSYPNCDQAG